LFGCSSSSDSSGSVSLEQACSDISSTLCGRINDCSPFFLTYSYGDLATCQSRAVVGCSSFPTAPGSTLTAAQIESCANALKNASCSALLDDGISTLPECDLKGTLDNGKSCAQNFQCSSGFCPLGSNGCGTCAPKTKAGDACVSGTCSDPFS